MDPGLALLVLPATAQAAAPFTAGSGEQPSVAVGSDGTGHVVWATDAANDQVGYCRVSAGAESCNQTQLLNFGTATDANDNGRARVFTPTPNKVVVVAGCWNCGGGDRIYSWTSVDNGATFGVPALIGVDFATEGYGTWLDDLGTFVAASGPSAKATNAPLAGPGVQYASGGLFGYGPEIARVPGTTKLVAATNDLEVVKYGVYNGAGPHTVASFNNTGNWLIERTLPSPEPDNSDTALNSGPNGLFLSYEYFVANDSHIGLRRFDPVTNTFGGAAYVEGGDAIDDNSLDFPDSFQDASGRIHVAWRSLYSGGRLRYRVSDTTGANFTAAANLAASEAFHEPEIAAGGDGRGFATWTNGTSGAVRIVPIDPTPEPVVPVPPATPPSGGSGGIDVTPPGLVGGIGIGDRTLLPGQGTTFRFRTSEAGLAVLTFEKRFKGVKVKTKRKGKAKAKTTCMPATKKRLRALRKKASTPRAYRKLLKKRRCKGWKRIGEIRQRVSAGANSIPFNGRIAGRKLTKGQYRGRLVITDAAGLASRTETIKFKVVAKKKPAAKRRRAGRR